MRTGPRGFGGVAPRNFFATMPLSLPENEGNAPLMNQGHRFMLVMPCSCQRERATQKGRKD